MTAELPPAVRTAAIAVAAGVVGVIIGLAGAIVHRHAIRPDDILVPWGLVLTFATMYSVTVAAARLVQLPGAIGVAVGWALTLLVLQQTRPEGDYLFAADFLGYAYVFGGMLTMLVAVVRGMTVVVDESSRS
ncbi:MAG TPA: DUF6113 family protein [Nocardioidaceae bacterium]|jgi:uncharacterized protein DUF6113|nr:DUF6113 family protein [Nocardioidaceae bacterium]